MINERLIYGELKSDRLFFYRRGNGVTKKGSSINEYSPHPQKDKYTDQSTINSQRKYIRYLAQEILQAIE